MQASDEYGVVGDRDASVRKFQPDLAILVSPTVMATPELMPEASWPQLRVEVVDERPS